jgi:hypothetical protein
LTPVNEYPEHKRTLGRWIGVSDNCINEMASVILTEKGQVILWKSIWGLSDDDLLNPVKKAAIAVMDERINSKINTSIDSVLPLPPKDLFNSEDDELIKPIEEGLASLELQDTTPAELDEYLSAKLLLPVGGERVPATVLKRRLDLDDKPIGKRNSNPKLDTREYDV